MTSDFDEPNDDFEAMFLAMFEGFTVKRIVGPKLSLGNLEKHCKFRVKLPPYDRPKKPETELEYLERLLSYTYISPDYKCQGDSNG